MQDVIGIAIGGRAAGLVFEGDRRFQIVVRLPDALRNDIEALENLPVAAAAVEPRRLRPSRSRCDSSRRFEFDGRAEPDQPRERQAARRRDRQRARARHRLAGRRGAGEDRASR